ncbi:universal stress protein [Streptosporangiaceae bacterium NEAU-GS5]|nr:universal stress protein [Streptosporangiaceae bacterium NEAU-GS5]
MSTFELGTDGPRVIVVGVDGSPTSYHAAAYAYGLARRQGSHLIIVFAADPGTAAAFVPGAAASAWEAGEQAAEALREEVEEAIRQAPARVPYTFRAENGDAASVLTRVADEVRADAVVVGASAKAGHRLVGSVAVRLVRAGRWPVTVVP